MSKLHSYHIYISSRLAVHRTGEPTRQMMTDLRKCVEQAKKLTAQTVTMLYDQGLLRSGKTWAVGYPNENGRLQILRNHDVIGNLWSSYRTDNYYFDDYTKWIAEFMSKELESEREKKAKTIKISNADIR